MPGLSAAQTREVKEQTGPTSQGMCGSVPEDGHWRHACFRPWGQIISSRSVLSFVNHGRWSTSDLLNYLYFQGLL